MDESTSYENVNRMLRTRYEEKYKDIIKKEREDQLKVAKFFRDQEEKKKKLDDEIRARFFWLAPEDEIITEAEFTRRVLYDLTGLVQYPHVKEFDRVRKMLSGMNGKNEKQMEENVNVMYNKVCCKFTINTEMRKNLEFYFLNRLNATHWFYCKMVMYSVDK